LSCNEPLARAGEDVNRLNHVGPLLQRINAFTPAQWLTIFTELWPKLRGSSGSTTPHSWPGYRNLLLRIYDAEEGQIYSMENLADTPDWQVCISPLRDAVFALTEEYDELPDETDLRERVKPVLDEAEALFKRCSLTPVWSGKRSAAVAKAVAFLNTEFKR
jgi:hypothetical protein